jgi:hypothetical protein
MIRGAESGSPEVDSLSELLKESTGFKIFITALTIRRKQHKNKTQMENMQSVTT